MTDTSNGTEWVVLGFAKHKNGTRKGDGDTLDLLRTRYTQLGDDWFHIYDPAPKPIRLAWVDTPERGDPGYQQAARDLTYWLEQATPPLTVICFGTAGWDRILADLRDADGNSAPQWLMTYGNDGHGWPAYVKGQ